MQKNFLSSFYSVLIDFTEILLIAVTVFILVYLFVGQLLEITGESMFPTLHNSEQIVAEKISIKISPLKRGEIVIVESPRETKKLLVKRVIGLPGENILIKDNHIYINNQIIKEPYLDQSVQTSEGNTIKENIEYSIENDSYVVMGDNRGKSTDSRDYGAVRKDLIVGRAIFVYYPLNKIRLIKYS